MENIIDKIITISDKPFFKKNLFEDILKQKPFYWITLHLFNKIINYSTENENKKNIKVVHLHFPFYNEEIKNQLFIFIRLFVAQKILKEELKLFNFDIQNVIDDIYLFNPLHEDKFENLFLKSNKLTQNSIFFDKEIELEKYRKVLIQKIKLQEIKEKNQEPYTNIHFWENLYKFIYDEKVLQSLTVYDFNNYALLNGTKKLLFNSEDNQIFTTVLGEVENEYVRNPVLYNYKKSNKKLDKTLKKQISSITFFDKNINSSIGFYKRFYKNLKEIFIISFGYNVKQYEGLGEDYKHLPITPYEAKYLFNESIKFHELYYNHEFYPVDGLKELVDEYYRFENEYNHNIKINQKNNFVHLPYNIITNIFNEESAKHIKNYLFSNIYHENNIFERNSLDIFRNKITQIINIILKNKPILSILDNFNSDNNNEKFVILHVMYMSEFYMPGLYQEVEKELINKYPNINFIKYSRLKELSKQNKIKDLLILTHSSKYFNHVRFNGAENIKYILNEELQKQPFLSALKKDIEYQKFIIKNRYSDIGEEEVKLFLDELPNIKIEFQHKQEKDNKNQKPIDTFTTIINTNDVEDINTNIFEEPDDIDLDDDEKYDEIYGENLNKKTSRVCINGKEYSPFTKVYKKIKLQHSFMLHKTLIKYLDIGDEYIILNELYRNLDSFIENFFPRISKNKPLWKIELQKYCYRNYGKDNKEIKRFFDDLNLSIKTFNYFKDEYIRLKGNTKMPRDRRDRKRICDVTGIDLTHMELRAKINKKNKADFKKAIEIIIKIVLENDYWNLEDENKLIKLLESEPDLNILFESIDVHHEEKIQTLLDMVSNQITKSNLFLKVENKNCK